MTTRDRMFSAAAAALLAAFSAGLGADPSESGIAMLSGHAKAAVAAYASALKSELTAAMQAGGPVQALDVCHTQAPRIADEISAQQGMRISRVSRRNRNPAAAPNAWQAAVLQDFETHLAAGTDPATLAWQEIVDVDGGREFRFMQAIATQPLCLTCHGDAIAPEVAATLSELYPDDKATGFAAGELRGAFVVTTAVD